MNFAAEPWHKGGVNSCLRSLLFVATAFFALTAQARTFHVSVNGDDRNPGTERKPFATLERARNELRTLKRAKPLREPINIVVHAGTYQQKATLSLTAEDSGTTKAPVIWQAADGEEVRFTGGLALAANDFHEVTNPATIARLEPAARGKIVEADLARIGATNIPAYPTIFRGVPAAPELLFNEQRMRVARWPNEGWATIAKMIESGSVPREGEKPDRPGTFEYDGDRQSRWRVESGVWLQGYWCYDWYEETIKVKSIDAKTRQITMAAPSLYGIKQGNPSPRRYRALNLLEELDQPGEFYIDRTAGLLYFWPPAAMDRARVALSLLDGPIIELKETEHVTVRGFIIEASLGDGMVVSGGRSNCIDSCTIRNIRQMGICVNGGAGHRVENCDIHDTGTGGLTLEGGDRKTLTAGGHQALNNHIWRFSIHQLTGAYGIILGGVGNRAVHNLLHDAPHQAILIRGNDHVFEYNEVHHVVTESDDAGALYKGRNPSCRGNIIRFNYWHDIGSTMGHGTAAIYFDDGDGGDLVFGNVFLRCGHPGRGSFGAVFSHGGHDNRAENNIFIECDRALGSAPWDDRRWKATVDGGEDCFWQEKLLKEVDITKAPFTNRYPELIGFMNPQPGQPRVNRAKNNVLVRCPEVSSGNWHYDAAEMWATDGDPGFVDAAKGNFKLRPDAEVFRRLPEFKPIPFEQIGLQRGRGNAGDSPKISRKWQK